MLNILIYDPKYMIQRLGNKSFEVHQHAVLSFSAY